MKETASGCFFFIWKEQRAIYMDSETSTNEGIWPIFSTDYDDILSGFVCFLQSFDAVS